MVFRRTLTRIVSALLVIAVIFSSAATAFATAGKYSKEAIEETRRRFSDKIVNIAMEQIGYYEDNTNKFIQWYYGGENESDWCAIFVSWCAGQAGCLDSAIPQRNACSSMRNFFKMNDEYYPVDSGYVPVKGDIVFWNTATDGTDDIHHVEIITDDGFHMIGGNECVKSIGGNTSNQYYHGWEYVAQKNRPVKGPRAEVVGYAHPSYEKAERLGGLIKTRIQSNRNDDLKYYNSRYIAAIYHIEKFCIRVMEYFEQMKIDTENWFKDLFNIKDDVPQEVPDTEESTTAAPEETTVPEETTEPVTESTTQATKPADLINGRPAEKLFPEETSTTEAA